MLSINIVGLSTIMCRIEQVNITMSPSRHVYNAFRLSWVSPVSWPLYLFDYISIVFKLYSLFSYCSVFLHLTCSIEAGVVCRYFVLVLD